MRGTEHREGCVPIESRMRRDADIRGDANATLECAYAAKYVYTFWRPITAIRNADLDGNGDTDADPARALVERAGFVLSAADG
jgi:hypothetical protein